MSDQNKTPLTHDVTAAMQRWMVEKGFKPIETEVPVCSGWCADLAAVIVPTQTELINLKLIERQPSWNERNSTRSDVKRRDWAEERWRAWTQRSRELAYGMYTAIVEVKTSRGDFRGDRKWTCAVPADMAFLAVPSGLITESEWPCGWGIVAVAEHTARMLRPPTLKRVADFQRADVINSIATRRDHHTRYERHREFQREQRDRENERKTLARVSDIARIVTRILRGEGGSVEEILAAHRDLKNLPEDVLAELRKFHGMRPRTEEELASERARHEAEMLGWELVGAERRARLRSKELVQA